MEKVFEWLTGQYGFIGLAIFVMAGVIAYLFIDAKKERKAMRTEHLAERESIRKDHLEERRLLQVTTDNHFNTIVKVTQENTDVLSEIKALVKTIERRGD